MTGGQRPVKARVQFTSHLSLATLIERRVRARNALDEERSSWLHLVIQS
jgi:hypothetical protein